MNSLLTFMLSFTCLKASAVPTKVSIPTTFILRCCLWSVVPMMVDVAPEKVVSEFDLKKLVIWAWLSVCVMIIISLKTNQRLVSDTLRYYICHHLRGLESTRDSMNVCFYLLFPHFLAIAAHNWWQVYLRQVAMLSACHLLVRADIDLYIESSWIEIGGWVTEVAISMSSNCYK